MSRRPSFSAPRSKAFKLRSFFPGVAVALALASVSGCANKGGTPAATSHDAKDVQARLEKMMARENGPFQKHKLELLDGLAAGEIEAQSAPKPECKKEEGLPSCTFSVELGKDEDGDAHNIICSTSLRFDAFGPTVKGLIDDGQLLETPRVEVKTAGEGIGVAFVANFSREADNSVSVGTMKVATFYAHGFMAECFDKGAGGRKTFGRIVDAYFQSLKFKEAPGRKVAFAFGYKERSGDRTTGLRFGYLATDPGSGATTQSEVAFSLTTDGKTWSVFDAGAEVVRDKDDAVESMRQLLWADGKGPLALSAKPGEDGKYRLKLEAGPRTNALESTPKAPFTTELWSAAELAKVANGGATSYRYATLGVNDDDPAFRYVTLTRAKPGVLLEEVEAGKRTKALADGAPQPKDEMTVDAKGLVTKRVSTDSVLELVHSWGQMPSFAARKGAPKDGAKKKGAAK